MSERLQDICLCMIITLAGQKGGAGKTTLAIGLSVEWMRRGKKVLLVDADPQATALTWAGLAAELEQAAPSVVAMGDNLRKTLPGVAKDYDLVVVDTPGRQTKRVVGAIMLADLVILPAQPSPADVWALAGTIDVIEEAREIRPDIRAVLVINGRTRTAIGAGARPVLEETGYPVLRTEIGRRTAFAESLATGQGVTAYQSGSVAALEIRNLVDEVGELMGGDE